MKTRAIWRTALLGIGLLGASVARLHADEPMPQEASMHAHHHLMSNMVTNRTVEYAVPPVSLVRADGKEVYLPKELDDGKPVVLNFMYTTCTTICPLTSQTFAAFQEKLGDKRGSVHLVSISIDPEQDTPSRLTDYAKKFHAGPEWQFYTGTLSASIATQRAFDSYRGDKMSHAAATFIRVAPGKSWLRIDGFVTPDDLLADYLNLVNAGS